MNIQVTCRHAKVSQETQQFLRDELKSLEKYYDRMTSCHVILDTEHIDKIVEIVVQIQGNTISAKAKSDNLGKSVDTALQKVARQLKKVNEKIKSHKAQKEEKVAYTAGIAD
jgi:putative sigma-54 modulation protein